jgi:glycosyltransferase involved in cell wall biosynthesis
MPVRLLPFINFVGIRQLTVGIVVLLSLIAWVWHPKRRNRQKIIFMYNLIEPPAIFAWLAGYLLRATTICCINDINVFGHTIPDRLIYRLAFWIAHKSIPLFDGRIVITKDIADDFARGHSCLIVPGAVDENLLNRFAKTAQRTCHSPIFKIVMAGNISELNGIKEVIEGFKLTSNPNYRLSIAGSGALQPLVEAAAETDSRIELLGYLSFEQVLALYEEADCIVNMRLTKRLKSNYLFPSKLFEYLASGKPVITTCPGHVADEYSQIAILLHEETAEALRIAIDTVAAMSCEERQRLGEKAVQHMREHSTWNAVGWQMVSYMMSINLKKRQS